MLHFYMCGFFFMFRPLDGLLAAAAGYISSTQKNSGCWPFIFWNYCSVTPFF